MFTETFLLKKNFQIDDLSKGFEFLLQDLDSGNRITFKITKNTNYVLDSGIWMSLDRALSDGTTFALIFSNYQTPKRRPCFLTCIENLLFPPHPGLLRLLIYFGRKSADIVRIHPRTGHTEILQSFRIIVPPASPEV